MPSENPNLHKLGFHVSLLIQGQAKSHLERLHTLNLNPKP